MKVMKTNVNIIKSWKFNKHYLHDSKTLVGPKDKSELQGCQEAQSAELQTLGVEVWRSKPAGYMVEESDST